MFKVMGEFGKVETVYSTRVVNGNIQFLIYNSHAAFGDNWRYVSALAFEPYHEVPESIVEAANLEKWKTDLTKSIYDMLVEAECKRKQISDEDYVGSYDWWLTTQGRENSEEEYRCYAAWKKWRR